MREQKTTSRGAQIEQNLVFAENLRRLLGVHDLEQTEAARLLGLSKASFSAWNAGRRRPSFPVALSIAEFFEIPADRLATAEFGDLLTHELADRGRFESVERKILADLERGFDSAAGPTEKPLDREKLQAEMLGAMGEEVVAFANSDKVRESLDKSEQQGGGEGRG